MPSPLTLLTTWIAPTVMPFVSIGVAIRVVVIRVLERSTRCWKRASSIASLTIVVRCFRATSPTKPVPIGIVVPISFWLAAPSASLQRSTSPSAIHSEPPAAPTAVTTVSKTLGSSSSKSSEELNSWLIECSRRRRSSSTRRSSAGTAGAPDSSAMRWKRRAARAGVKATGIPCRRPAGA